jgi:putative lipoprotein (rSAM/lipoprotein system)
MKWSSLLIAKILTLCGISLTCTACYGIPSREYMAEIEIKGMVISEKTHRPVEGVRVAVKRYAENYEFADVTTNRAGWYRISTGILVDSDDAALRLDIVAEDIDGAENGGDFSTVTKNIPVEHSDNVFQATVDFELQTKPE